SAVNNEPVYAVSHRIGGATIAARDNRQSAGVRLEKDKSEPLGVSVRHGSVGHHKYIAKAIKVDQFVVGHVTRECHLVDDASGGCYLLQPSTIGAGADDKVATMWMSTSDQGKGADRMVDAFLFEEAADGHEGKAPPQP